MCGVAQAHVREGPPLGPWTMPTWCALPDKGAWVMAIWQYGWCGVHMCTMNGGGGGGYP